MGDVEQPERLDVGLAEDRALPAELEEHVDDGQHALDLRQHGFGLRRTANRQMLAARLVLRLRRLAEGGHHLALDPCRTSGGAVRICSDVNVIPIMLASP